MPAIVFSDEHRKRGRKVARGYVPKEPLTRPEALAAVQQWTPLAYGLAAKLAKTGGERSLLEDYQQEAMLGLWEATRKFDKAKKNKKTGKSFEFGTFASFQVLNRLLSFAREQLYWHGASKKHMRLKELAESRPRIVGLGRARADTGETLYGVPEPADRYDAYARADAEMDGDDFLSEVVGILESHTTRDINIWLARVMDEARLHEIAREVGLTKERVRQVVIALNDKIRQELDGRY